MKTLHYSIIIIPIIVAIILFNIFQQPVITISTDKKIYDDYNGVEVLGTGMTDG